MNYRTMGALAVLMALSAQARAQDEEKKDLGPRPRAKDAAPPVAAVVDESPAAQSQAPQRPVVYGKRADWSIQPYGYARLDAIQDSTQSFEDGIQPNLVARPGTYKGDHQRSILTAKDSRLGVFVGAPPFEGMKSSATIEFDFYGLTPTDARRTDTYIFGPVRIRHAYLRLETKIVDVVAGQYHDLFGWGSYYYPATVAYLGVPGQIYHRNAQLRIEKKISAGDLEVTAAVAAVKPGQRDSGVPEAQGGFRVAYHGWSGAANPGFGRPALAPISIGVSGLYRRFEVPAFKSEPGSETLKTSGYGVAVSGLVPVIPVKTIEDRSNALTLTGEFSMGAGIADMYTGMDGGSRFPILPDLTVPPVVYQVNVDPGLVTIDRNFEVKAIKWKAFVAGLQYYLPVGGGRVWLAGTYSRIWSDNIKTLTPQASWGGIFTKMEYIDVSLGVDITRALVLGLSFQTVKQTFGDVSPPTPIFGAPVDNMLGGLSIDGTGGVPASARNNRGQVSMALFF